MWQSLTRRVGQKTISKLRTRRCLSTAGGVDEAAYIEQWQKNQIKSLDFYAEMAEKRQYFYTVDLQVNRFLN